MSLYSVVLTVYTQLKQVDVSVRLHKDSVWEAENVYVSLPFQSTAEQKEELWFDKPGGPIRPNVDQIPGTGVDFYCIQEGLLWKSSEMGVALATPYAPLVQVGPLEHQIRTLYGEQDEKTEAKNIFSWILDNYWETNFHATIGGCYEFNYSVIWDEKLENTQKAIEYCRIINTGLPVLRLNGI